MTDTLIAGRELDALIAEKVLGAVWSPVPTKEESGLDFPETHWLQFPSKNGSFVLAYRSFNTGSHPCTPLKGYSTDIAAAWEVVEKLRENGWGFAIMDSQPPTPWEVTFDHIATAETHILRAETAPLGICLTALKAVGQ